MNLGLYGILIVFGLFVLLLIFNPNLSCFGKRMRSPLYPLFRKKKKRKERETEDYGFHLADTPSKQRPEKERPKIKTEDYDYFLVDNGTEPKPREKRSIEKRIKEKRSREETDVHSDYKVDSD